jgi:hypothetical protein
VENNVINIIHVYENSIMTNTKNCLKRRDQRGLRKSHGQGEFDQSASEPCGNTTVKQLNYTNNKKIT